MLSRPGSYALILKSTATVTVSVGRMGRLDVIPGYYVYVGSAFGPGGVRARVLRHSRKDKKRHWHIDYLREIIDFECAWYSYQPDKLEHHWAKVLAGSSKFSSIRGFGCSDCRCGAHLFYTSHLPDFDAFTRTCGNPTQVWQPTHQEYKP